MSKKKSVAQNTLFSREKLKRLAEWRDHMKPQTVFMHTNVSTCDFLRFDANEKGDFEAQKLEKSRF